MLVSQTVTVSNSNSIPEQLERYLIEVVPDLICQLPYIKINNVLLDTYKTHTLTQVARDALCYARSHGTAYLYVNSNGTVTINAAIDLVRSLYPDVVVANNPEYETYTIQNDLFKSWRTGVPLITESVCEAYGLFINAQRRAYLRLKNGNATLMSLMDGEEDEEQLDAEVIKSIDERFEIQNRLYAPEGSKLTGTSVSLDGIQATLDAFWENIFRSATIPAWAFEKQQLNSSFTIEHMAMEKKRLWFKEVYPVLQDILQVVCPSCKIRIDPPDFLPEKYRQEVNVLKADVRNRDAVSKNQLAQAMKVTEETKYLGQKPEANTSSSSSKDKLNSAKKTGKSSAPTQ